MLNVLPTSSTGAGNTRSCAPGWGMALEAQPALVRSLGEDWPGIRVGVASGPIVAGVIGHERFGVDICGDTVNTASRMAGAAAPGGLQVTEVTCCDLPPLPLRAPRCARREG